MWGPHDAHCTHDFGIGAGGSLDETAYGRSLGKLVLFRTEILEHSSLISSYYYAHIRPIFA